MPYYIGPRCSACHYCYNECPVGAIRFVGTSYEIDEFKCISCGKCAEVCPSSIIYNPAEVQQPVPHDPEERQCDLVVLGAGGSGLVAAVRAAQLTGKKVIVLEKTKKPGGNTNLGHGFLMRYTKWHEAAGLPDTREDFLNKLYEDTGRVMDYEMLKNAIYGLSDMFDWLCTLGDVEKYFKLMKPGDPGVPPGISFAMIDFPQRIDNVKSSDTSMGPGWMGTFVIRKMLEVGKSLGVEVLTEHRAVKLLQNETGAFSGVVAENPGGIVTVHAKGCVIATGGFAHNDTLMTKTNPDFFKGNPVKRLSVASSTGDGMNLVREIGGQLDLERLRVPASGPVHHPFNYTVMSLGGFGSPTFDLTGHEVKLMGGGPGSPTGPLDQVEGCCVYTIVDSETVSRMGKQAAERNTDPSAQKSKDNYQYEIDFEASCGYPARKAWTLEGLAEKIGVNPAIFTEEVRKHNSEVDLQKSKQKDAPPVMGPFGPMTPEKIEAAPFYAIYGGRFSESASGGIVTDTTLEVVKEDGSVIPGLWAVGDSCRGLFVKDDSGGKFGEMPWAMASGYLAGGYAAAFI